MNQGEVATPEPKTPSFREREVSIPYESGRSGHPSYAYATITCAGYQSLMNQGEVATSCIRAVSCSTMRINPL